MFIQNNYGKSYGSAAEDEAAYRNFRTNYINVQRHNTNIRNGARGADVGINKFSDMVSFVSMKNYR